MNYTKKKEKFIAGANIAEKMKFVNIAKGTAQEISLIVFFVKAAEEGLKNDLAEQTKS